MKQDLIQRHLLRRSWLSYLLYPLSLVWKAVVVQRRHQWQKNAFTAPVRIISSGNLVSGGSGKTPFTIMLAGLLQRNGIKVGVSHRGYKGAYEYAPSLISGRDGVYPEALQAGDEAQLIAERLPGVPVVCGKGRRTAIHLLLKRYPDLQVVILDDSFQHVQVRHDLDFVLFSSVTGLGNGYLLPAGYLREPPSVLNENHVAVITCPESESPESIDRLAKQISRHTTRIITSPLKVEGVFDLSGAQINTEVLRREKVALVSAIGNPETFERSVSAFGISFERHFRFPDHYDYRDESATSRLAEYCTGNNIQRLLTTEKDWIKLKGGSGRLPWLCFLRVNAQPLITEKELIELAMGG